jgi:hypothetical protein
MYELCNLAVGLLYFIIAIEYIFNFLQHFKVKTRLLISSIIEVVFYFSFLAVWKISYLSLCWVCKFISKVFLNFGNGGHFEQRLKDILVVALKRVNEVLLFLWFLVKGC